MIFDIKHLMCSRCCAKNIYTILLIFTTSKDRYYYYPHFKDERDVLQINCKVSKLEIQLRVLKSWLHDSRAHMFFSICYHYNCKKLEKHVNKNKKYILHFHYSLKVTRPSSVTYQRENRKGGGRGACRVEVNSQRKITLG